MNKRDALLREKTGLSQAQVVRNIERTFESASAADMNAGLAWYAEGGAIIADLANRSGQSREHVAAVIGQLSPRTTWKRNVDGAYVLILGGRRMDGILGANYGRAVVALKSDDPIATIGGRKVQSFVRNLLGDSDAVTIDVWAMRVALAPDWKRGQELDDNMLKRAGVYDALAECYRIVARRHGVSPAAVQAACWVKIRNGRAN